MRKATTDAEVQHRLEELHWLLDGGVWPPTACARVGWSLSAACIAARRRGDWEIMRIMTKHHSAQKQGVA